MKFTAHSPHRFRAVRILGLLGLGAACLGLAGCGVKGGLESPLNAATDKTSTEAPVNAPKQTTAAPAAIYGTSSSIARGTTSEPVTQAPASRDKIFLDWLVR